MPRQERTKSGTGIYHVMLKGINKQDIFEEGYCQAESYVNNSSQDVFTFCYYDRDHLGNIRQVTEADGSSTGSVIQTMNYYPFGAEFCDGTANSSVQSHKYNGKELDLMHGLNTYDYGARQYNPVTAHWDRVDPLCEKYYSLSPYNYCGNNPIRFVDMDGMKWENPDEANNLKENINEQISYLNKQINKDLDRINNDNLSEKKIHKLNGKISENRERISILTKSIEDIDRLANDGNTYAFYRTNEGEHHVRKEGEIIYIETFSDAMSIHEITHVRQALDANYLKFDSNNMMINPGLGMRGPKAKRIADNEIEAYKAQYSYDKSFPGYTSNLQGINVHSVGYIQNENGQYIYPIIHDLSKQIKRNQKILENN